MIIFNTTRLPCLLLVAVVLSGCGHTGPKRYPISGHVTYKNKPVTIGIVTFVPEHGHVAVGTIGTDGSYALQAAAGTYRVAVKAVPPPPPGKDYMREEGYEPPQSLIPVKYSRLTTSGLTVEVKANDNVIDLELQ